MTDRSVASIRAAYEGDVARCMSGQYALTRASEDIGTLLDSHAELLEALKNFRDYARNTLGWDETDFLVSAASAALAKAGAE